MTDSPETRVSNWIDRIPELWSKRLFAATANTETGLRLRSLLILLAIPALLLYPTRSFLLLEPDEGRYAQIAREMLDAGTWVVPTLQGEAYLDKPPLFYWLVKLSFELFGVSDSSARLVPALATHLTILGIYLIGRRSVGEQAAFWAGLTLSILPGFMGMSRLLIMDGVLTLTVTMEMLCLYEAIRCDRLKAGWWYAAAVCSGLGMLTKGPIAILLVIPPVVAQRWLTRRQTRASFYHLLGYFAIIVAINLPWYLAIYRREPIFLKHFFWDHNVMRFLQPFDHLQPVWYYLPVFILSALPCLLLGRSLFRWLVADTSLGRTAAAGFWLLAGGWCLLFFSVSGSKLPTYILPAFPPLALVFGCFIASSKWQDRLSVRAGSATWVGILFVAFGFAVPYYAQQRSPMRDRELIQRLCTDPQTPIVCFPRNCDSVAFYLHRQDLIGLRGKQANDLLKKVLEVPKTVVLFTHDHSLGTFEPIMPHDIFLKEAVSLRIPKKEQTLFDRVIGVNPWGLCDIAVVQHKRWGRLTVREGIDSAEINIRNAEYKEDHDDGDNGPDGEACNRR